MINGTKAELMEYYDKLRQTEKKKLNKRVEEISKDRKSVV